MSCGSSWSPLEDYEMIPDALRVILMRYGVFTRVVGMKVLSRLGWIGKRFFLELLNI